MNKIDTKVQSGGSNRKTAARDWKSGYQAQVREDRTVRNRSGLEIQPLYWPEEGADANYDAKLGFPGSEPMTRGIYPSMHRGRTWTQRQLIGLGRSAGRFQRPDQEDPEIRSLGP